MVARINTSKSISKALNYNEQKVINGKAECVLVSAFIHDLHNTEKLQEIANAYMVKIGFEKQPYLVYKHSDAGHLYPYCKYEY